jgi:hypothetical protein
MGRWLVYNEMLDITRNDLNRSGIRVLVKGVGEWWLDTVSFSLIALVLSGVVWVLLLVTPFSVIEWQLSCGIRSGG